jgi:hypothetical protein
VVILLPWGGITMQKTNEKQLTLDKIIGNQNYIPTFEDIFPKVKSPLIQINQALEIAVPNAKGFFETQSKEIDRY